MLAHTVEEEGDDSFELLPWAGGPNWQSKTYEVFSKRDNLFKRIDYRALVSRKCCLQVAFISFSNFNSIYKEKLFL